MNSGDFLKKVIMHNKAFLITQEIPRCQQHGHRDLIRFLLCVQLNPVEAKGESARLTAPKNLLPRHREGWRRVEGRPEDQAENVQDTLYHMHPAMQDTWMSPPSRDQMKEERRRSLQQTG